MLSDCTRVANPEINVHLLLPRCRQSEQGPANLAITDRLLCVLLLASLVKDEDLVWLQTKLMVDLQISPCTICSTNGDFALDV